MPAGAAGNLPNLLRLQRANADTVELLERGESNVIDIHVDAHADGIRCHQKIDIARLIQRNLRVARARRERTKHDRCAATLPTHEFRQPVHIVGRERDHG